MILIFCVDDNLGLAFNHRRQSRDKALCQRILEITAGHALWMTPYSAKLFGEAPNLHIAEDCLTKAGAGEYCFAELALPQAALDRAEGVVLYRWNRSYPADVTVSFPGQSWHRTESCEFAGHSHETITEETYVK